MTAPEAARPPFEVLDALDGLCRLSRRSPTLDGAVPLRVAQACVPLLEGNAHGFQVIVERPVRVRKRLGRWRAEPDGGLAALHAAALPRLAAQGFFAAGSAWPAALGGAAVQVDGWRGRVRLWTGLVVRTRPGVRLRLTGAANRRNVLVDVTERYVEDPDRWVPVVVELSLSGDVDDVLLAGEIACVSALRTGIRIDEMDLCEAPELGQAHLRFYDGEYFAEKREGATRSYRRLLADRETRPPDDTRVGGCRIVAAGPRHHELVTHDEVQSAAGPTPSASAGPPVTEALWRAPIDFSFAFDGQTLDLAWDRAALALAAGEVRAAWARALPAEVLTKAEGALLYLTKLFTPHPRGEPHFFLKPWAFVQTPPGIATLLDGVCSAGYDVLRGVIESDVFHAAPAVFAARATGKRIHIAAGTPLLRLLPFSTATAEELPAVRNWAG